MIEQAILLYAVGLVLFLVYIGLEYYFGALANSAERMASARANLSTAFMNTLLFIFIMLFVTAYMGVRASSFGGTPGMLSFLVNTNMCIEDYVFSYLNNLSNVLLPAVMRDLTVALSLVQTTSAFTSGFSYHSIVSGNSFDLSMIEKVLNTMIMFMMPVFGSIYVQMLSISIIVSIFPFLLSAGLFLRLFPAGKRSGTFLVALALSTYIIFISMYALNAYIITNIISVDRIFFSINIVSPSWTDLFSSSSSTSSFVNILNVITSGGLTQLFSFFTLHPLLKYSFVAFQGIVLPTFAMIVTTTALHSFMGWLDQFV